MKKFLIILLVFLISCDDDSKKPACGDGVINVQNEECDQNDIPETSCAALGYYGGVVTCTNTCTLDISSCIENGKCGDGTINGTETESNCCIDTDCEFGVCDGTIIGEMSCIDSWDPDCSEITNQCSVNEPWLCDGELPTYDCGQCGCPGDEVCSSSVCYTQEVLDLERDSYMVPNDFELDHYFFLMDYAMDGTTLTYAEASNLFDSLLKKDKRRVALILGESHNSDFEQAVGIQMIRDVVSNGWNIIDLGVEDNGSPLISQDQIVGTGLNITSIAGNLTNVSYCNAVSGGVQNTTNDVEGVYIQYIGSGHTSQEVSHFTQHWGICSYPHVAECVTIESRKSLVLILWDPNVWLGLTDQVLLSRLDDIFTDRTAVTTELDTIIARWQQTISGQNLDPYYDSTCDGSDLNVRIFKAPNTKEDVYFAYFPTENRPAWFLQSYRAIWENMEIQNFLFDNYIRPRNCSISWNLTPGAEEISFLCSDSGINELDAVVDATNFTIKEYTITQ
jgi:hypothetical protein